MGLFWDLMQQSAINEQAEKGKDLEARVSFLEGELKRTQETLYKTLVILEKLTQKDIDGDGRIG